MGSSGPFLLILASLLGSLGQENLEKKVFVFPTATNTAHVLLKAPIQQPLSGYTVCLRFHSELTRTYALFSYATVASDNEILLHHDRPNVYSLFMKRGVVTFNVSDQMTPATGKKHVCVSWDSSTGLVAFWWNGHPLARKALMKGQQVNKNGSLILGQEQDSVGGGFDRNQSFVGEMDAVHMWDRALSSEEVCDVWDQRTVGKPIVNWRALSYAIVGEVIVAPSLICSCRVGCTCGHRGCP